MKIFVSYSTKDKADVSRIVNELQIAGHEVWWDQHLLPEQLWQQNLNKQLVEAQVLCVVLSPQSLLSDWVQREYQFALEQQNENNMRVIPVMIESCDPPDDLSHIQLIDMTDFPDSMWGLTGLLRTLSDGADFLADAADYGDTCQIVSLNNQMPPWQRSVEAMLHDDKFYSRSIVTIAMRCNLTVLEVTRYCLSAQHIVLSPYLTPSAQPIPYFGLKCKIFKRYKHQQQHYLAAIQSFFNLIKEKKAHREFSQCWSLIREHFADEFDDQQSLVVTLQHQYQDMWITIVRDGSDFHKQIIENDLNTAERKVEILTVKQLKGLPSAVLKSALFAANNVIIDGQVDANWIYFLLGFRQGQSLIPQNYWLVGDARNIDRCMMTGVNLTTVTAEQILKRLAKK